MDCPIGLWIAYTEDFMLNRLIFAKIGVFFAILIDYASVVKYNNLKYSYL